MLISFPRQSAATMDNTIAVCMRVTPCEPSIGANTSAGQTSIQNPFSHRRILFSSKVGSWMGERLTHPCPCPCRHFHQARKHHGVRKKKDQILIPFFRMLGINSFCRYIAFQSAIMHRIRRTSPSSLSLPVPCLFPTIRPSNVRRSGCHKIGLSRLDNSHARKKKTADSKAGSVSLARNSEHLSFAACDPFVCQPK